MHAVASGATSRKSQSKTFHLNGGSVTVGGRNVDVIHKLMAAGDKGISAFDFPTGVRLSHNILELRKAGFHIDMEREPHGGDHPGFHGRYRLLSAVSVAGKAAA